MKVSHQIDSLEPMILDSLKGISGEDWHRAPRNKWSLAQIVDHLAIAVDLVATTFEKRADKKNMSRRATPRQHLLRHLVLGVGELPKGTERTANTTPAERPDPEEVQASFRIGVERLKQMVEEWPREQQERVYVAHPAFGDFNLPEWIRFLYTHCKHYRGSIDRRIKWLQRSQKAS